MDDVVTKISLSPKLICNNRSKNIKVIEEIRKNLDKCDDFCLSIAFVSASGIASIKQELLNIIENKVSGKIITSTYLGFNSPEMFKSLYELFKNSNVKIKIYQKDGFHPKGYIFNNKDNCNIIIGSSNLTQDALSVNQEWNICLSGNKNDEIVERINREFYEQWNDFESIELSEEWINEYKENYLSPLKYYVARRGKKDFEPNKMQTEALENLKAMRKERKNKALLISATGTGKTYLSAFDVKEFNPRRMLYVVHRETIARKSMESFKDVIRNKKMGMFTGTQKDYECDYLFATINTIGKNKYLQKFQKNEFDYIVIDEVHRAGAETYVELFNYFEPQFILGMSATPERTDDPEKIYELFDYNIAYEIRLKQAMEYELLCPFHYYGVSDLKINNQIIDDKTEFKYLVREDRVKHVIDAIEKYGYSGDKPHGLIFVRRKEEAITMSKLFNEMTNYKTIALTSASGGGNVDEYRRKAISLLEETDTSKEYLDYIFTVDIFNEGVDIPCINQVIMLRPTKSSIIFIQQLGRGLRKNDEKEYVSVIDIIGNYDNNYMIPIALSGSKKGNKDELRRFVYDGDKYLPGSSTISFDQITKSRIYQSIDKSNLNKFDFVEDEYLKLKAKLGNKIPTLDDFDKHSSIDPLSIFSSKRNGNFIGSYYNFLTLVEDEYEDNNSLGNNKEMKLNCLRMISMKFASGKRVQELELIKLLVENRKDVINELKSVMSNKYGIELNSKTEKTLVNQMIGKYYVGSDAKKYNDIILMSKIGNTYETSEQFNSMLSNKVFRDTLLETLNFGIRRYNENYINKYEDTDFVLYQKYTYDDVFRLLNWEKSAVAQNVGGYKYNEYTNTFPVFINYDKSSAADEVKYSDKISSDGRKLIAVSKNNRNLNSPEAHEINDAEANGTQIHVFVRKDKEDPIKEFYYLGLVNKASNNNLIYKQEEKRFEIPYLFKTTVREDIVSYLNDNKEVTVNFEG